MLKVSEGMHQATGAGSQAGTAGTAGQPVYTCTYRGQALQLTATHP